MKNLKCSDCGFVSWSDAAACRRCGRTFNESDAATESVTTTPFITDFSATENQPTRLKSYGVRILEHRILVACGLGMVLLGSLLNQTYFVSSWFVPKETSEILLNLDQRTKTEPSGKLRETTDRLKTLAVHASRGRQSAIRELVNLDVETLGMRVPNPGTRKAEEHQNLVRSLGPHGGTVDGIPLSYREAENLSNIAYDPGVTGSYRKREASIGDYVGDILLQIGEPAVEPIMERIKTIHEAEKAGITSMAAEMPRELLMALGRLKSPLALDRLITYASSEPHSYNNLKAIEALSLYESPDQRLLEIFDMALTESRTPTKIISGNYAVRVASEGLARIKSAESLQILISHLDLGDWEQAPSYVVRAIVRFGKPAAPAVLGVVRDSRAAILARQNGVQCLGLLRAYEARSDVIALLDSTELHEPAAQALAYWNKEDTIPDLQAATKRHPEWNREFHSAIQSIKN